MTGSVLIEPLTDLSVATALTCFANEDLLLLLDSAATARPQDGRYTFLTADPVAQHQIDVCHHGDNPFAILREWQQRLPALPADCPPFCGGVAGLMSYELGHAFEHLPRVPVSDFTTPALLSGLFDWAIVWDHQSGNTQLYVLCLDDPQHPTSLQRQQARRDWVHQQLSSAAIAESPALPACAADAGGSPDYQSSFAPKDYVQAVQQVIDYIGAGDIFQANLSQQLTASWNGTAVELYQQVRTQNAAPFCGLLQTPDLAVISASPERFLQVRQGRFVETRPIKGTRRRQQSPIADLYTAEALQASEKDRAENVMIVDLLRNDISRVCRTGSVQVTGVCEIEVFETVQHLVSTIVGELSADHDVWDLCAACIPGGSVTGAPKIRAMEIISELEQIARGAYCGNLFYCGPNADFDSSILIRTFTLRNGRVVFPVGGGIVADSLPQDEYDETLHKASGMLKCLPGVSASE